MNSTNCSKCSSDFTFDFSERLRKVRNARKLTQKYVAEKLGYQDQKRYNNYENNRVPNLEEIIRIADILDCDVEYLCGLQGDYFRRDSKTIVEASGLSQEAAENLTNHEKDGFSIKVLDALLKDYRFDSLLRKIWFHRQASISNTMEPELWEFRISNTLRDMYKDIDQSIFQ